MSEVKLTSVPTFNDLEIIKSGSTTVISPEATQSGSGCVTEDATVIINHNLGYIPIILAYVDFLGTFISLNYTLPTSSANSITHEFVYGYSDNTTISFVAGVTIMRIAAGTTSIGSTEYPIKYYLMRERARSI